MFQTYRTPENELYQYWNRIAICINGKMEEKEKIIGKT
jgi:hypothetical protein